MKRSPQLFVSTSRQEGSARDEVLCGSSTSPPYILDEGASPEYRKHLQSMATKYGESPKGPGVRRKSFCGSLIALRQRQAISEDKMSRESDGEKEEEDRPERRGERRGMMRSVSGRERRRSFTDIQKILREGGVGGEGGEKSEGRRDSVLELSAMRAKILEGENLLNSLDETDGNVAGSEESGESKERRERWASPAHTRDNNATSNSLFPNSKSNRRTRRSFDKTPLLQGGQRVLEEAMKAKEEVSEDMGGRLGGEKEEEEEGQQQKEEDGQFGSMNVRKKRSSLRYSAMVNSYKGREMNSDSLDGRLNQKQGEVSTINSRRARMTTVFKKNPESRVRRRSFHGTMRTDMSIDVGTAVDGDWESTEKFSSRFTVPLFPTEPKLSISPVTLKPQRSRHTQDDSPNLFEMRSSQGMGSPGGSSDGGGEVDYSSIVDDFLEEEGINRSQRLRATGWRGGGGRTREGGVGLEQLIEKKNGAVTDSKSSLGSLGSASAFHRSDSSLSSPGGGGTPPRGHRNTFEVGFLGGLRSSLDLSMDCDDWDDEDGDEESAFSLETEDPPVTSRSGGMAIPLKQKKSTVLETIAGSPS